MKLFHKEIFNIESATEFQDIALDVFKFQATQNEVYSTFIQHLGVNVSEVGAVTDIPYLPVGFFKSHKIITPFNASHEVVFTSSATTGVGQSKHYVHDLSMYQESFLKGFEYFFDDPRQYCILALLPSYQEREGSSLIFMVDALINLSAHTSSGYFLNENAQLVARLKELAQSGQKTILIGVTYALLDLAEAYQLDLKDVIIMETGGMKGRRKEMVREELHEILTSRLGVSKIASEYGMTELLGQAYSVGNGVFKCPPWMKVMARDTNDPLHMLPAGQSGGLNIVDLSNLYGCSFLATQDLGKVFPDGSFEVLGRFDNSDIRGCNLLVQ